VKKLKTPLTGGASEIGFVTSIIVFPARFSTPAKRNASADALPFTAKTTSSPNSAVSAKLPTRAAEFRAAQSANFAGSRVPSITS